MNVKTINPERRLKYLQQYMGLWIDCWPNRMKPFTIWLESEFDKKITKGQKEAARKMQSKCRYCQRLFDERVEKTKDHVVATSKGGLNVQENKIPCCWDCNQWKRDKTLDQWVKELKSLAKKQKGRPPFNEKQVGLIFYNAQLVYDDALKNEKKISTYKLKQK